MNDSPGLACAAPRFSIAGYDQLSLAQPRSAAEIGEVVRQAAGKGLAVYPLGGGTLLDMGLPPTRPGYAVCTCGLAGVVDYPVRDMTITVEAGIKIAILQTLLHENRQRLAVDVPRAGEATVGGALAANCSGPRRFGFGTWRDHVIGLRAINDRGEEIKSGGRVVKNVAGYDLCKLYIGSLGTLGIVTQVTLRVRPMPLAQAIVLVGSPASRLPDLHDALHRTQTRPVCIDLLNRSAVQRLRQTSLPDAPWLLMVGFEDNAEAVDWQQQQLIAELNAFEDHPIEIRAGAGADPLWQALSDFPAMNGEGISFKVNGLPSATATLCQQIASYDAEISLQAHAGNGIVVGHTPSGRTYEQCEALQRRLQALAAESQGNVVITRCPPAWKANLAVWGLPRSDAWLMRRLKGILDPQNIFSPGRFMDWV
jgi:glycolate oxidase FAD binding subunit